MSDSRGAARLWLADLGVVLPHRRSGSNASVAGSSLLLPGPVHGQSVLAVCRNASGSLLLPAAVRTVI